jgi:hypothetical protein
MVRDLLAGFVPREWVEELDLSTLERWPGSHVSDDLRQRHQDRVWRVRLRDRWLYVLVLLEFQSAVDRTMAVRILAYTALLYQDLLRASSDPLPPVLPIVLYDGSERWTAAKDVAGLLAPYGEPLAPYQPSQRYFLLDVRGYTDSLPEGRNRVAELIRLAGSRGLKEMATMFVGLAEWLSEPEHEGLIRAFWEWLAQVHLPAHGLDVELPVLKNWKEAGTMMNEAVNDWTAPWREEGRAEGRAQGQTEVMRRMAARKFDAGTAQRLAERLAEIADPERMAEVGEWLIECEHGDELLDRVESLCGTSAGGDDPSRG